MKKRYNILRYSLVILLIIQLIIILVSCTNKVEYERNDQLKVHFINVGQGECILVQQGKENMIICEGENESEEIVKKYLEDLKIEKLDYVIGIHDNKNKIGLLNYIISRYDVSQIYLPKQIYADGSFEKVKDSCINKHLNLNNPEVKEDFKLGEAECTFLSPQNRDYEDINNSSIVLKVNFKNTIFILTGDAGKEAENEMLNLGIDLKADVLKVGCNGSEKSTIDAFLEAVNPKYAVINVEEEPPSDEVLDKLRKREIKVYRSDEGGNIIITSYGETMTFNTVSGSYR